MQKLRRVFGILKFKIKQIAYKMYFIYNFSLTSLLQKTYININKINPIKPPKPKIKYFQKGCAFFNSIN